MSKEWVSEEYGVYPFKVQLLIGRFTPTKLEIASDGEVVSLEVIDERKKKKAGDTTYLTLEADEIGVLIETLSLFKKRIERGIPTVIRS